MELYLAHRRKELGAMMLTYTGNALFNIFMRSDAKDMGLKLNQYGLFTRDGEVVLQSEWEEPFFAELRRRYVPPELRNPG